MRDAHVRSWAAQQRHYPAPLVVLGDRHGFGTGRIRSTSRDHTEQLHRHAALSDERALVNALETEDLDRLGQQRRLLDGIDKPGFVTTPAASGNGGHGIAIRNVTESPKPAGSVQQCLNTDAPLLL